MLYNTLMQNNSKILIRSFTEKRNLGLPIGIVGFIFIIISLFLIPLAKEETRRFGEDVIIYDYFAMTIFHVFVVIGILLFMAGVVLTIIYLLKARKVIKNENQN